MAPPSKAGLRHAVSEWMLPPGVKRALTHVVKVGGPGLAPREKRAIVAASARLNGAYAGRRCFVIGNGPSLAALDLTPLAGEVTVVMNAFNQHPALKLWQPTIHCMAEPANAYAGKPEKLDLLKTCLAGYTTTTHVFPVEMKPILDSLALVPPELVAYVAQDGTVAAKFDRIDLTRPVPSAHDTSILAVSVAIAMGCDPIVLLGVDYTWLSHRSIHTHFYDDASVPWGAVSLGTYTYLEQIRFALKAWEAHAALRRIAADHGQTILNATEGSFLDVYPATTLAEVLAGN
jgi:hypothetical protein